MNVVKIHQQHLLIQTSDMKGANQNLVNTKGALNIFYESIFFIVVQVKLVWD